SVVARNCGKRAHSRSCAATHSTLGGGGNFRSATPENRRHIRRNLAQVDGLRGPDKSIANKVELSPSILKPMVLSMVLSIPKLMLFATLFPMLRGMPEKLFSELS